MTTEKELDLARDKAFPPHNKGPFCDDTDRRDSLFNSYKREGFNLCKSILLPENEKSKEMIEYLDTDNKGMVVHLKKHTETITSLKQQLTEYEEAMKESGNDAYWEVMEITAWMGIKESKRKLMAENAKETVDYRLKAVRDKWRKK